MAYAKKMALTHPANVLNQVHFVEQKQIQEQTLHVRDDLPAAALIATQCCAQHCKECPDVPSAISYPAPSASAAPHQPVSTHQPLLQPPLGGLSPSQATTIKHPGLPGHHLRNTPLLTHLADTRAAHTASTL
jgi:hypothetical protein